MGKILRKIIYLIGALDKWVLVFGSIMMIILLGFLDYLSGFELSFSLFYLLPVSIIAWFVGRNGALAMSAFSALAWFISNMLAGKIYPHFVIGYWNTFVRLGFFTIISILLTSLKQVIEKEKALSRTDYLTGITNSRSFYELASTELLRAKRYSHPLTVAYIDIDNFKQINDQLGHSTGDKLLRVVAETLQINLRCTDVVARMGGDEFVILLLEADEKSAKAALYKIRSSLLESMKKNKWGVTFSIGVITFNTLPPNIDEVLRKSDELMYRVKASGKNNIRFDSTNICSNTR